MDAPAEPTKASEGTHEEKEWRLKGNEADADWKGGEKADEKQGEERSEERGWGMATEGEAASDESE